MTEPKVPIIQACYQLTLRCYERVGSFPRALRPVFHDRFSKTCHEVLDAVVAINNTHGADLRHGAILRLSPKIASLRLTIRLARDLKALSIGQYSELSLMLEEFNAQLLAWQNWHQAQIAKGPKKNAGSSSATMAHL